MATPNEWLNEFQVNTGAAATGTQDDPQIVGLANGNVLVVWEEQVNGVIGTSPGADIIAKIYSPSGPSGALVRNAFQLNSFAFLDDEQEFDVTPTHD